MLKSKRKTTPKKILSKNKLKTFKNFSLNIFYPNIYTQMSYTQKITLVKINDIDVKPITKVSIIHPDSDDSFDTDPEMDSDTDVELKVLNLKVPEKRGRKKLTAEEKDISNILKKEYFKLYYKQNPSKYKYDLYDHNNSCVYKLTNINTTKIYIGSTVLPLSLRLKRHLTCLRHPANTTYMEMAHYGLDWTIEPIIKIPLESKQKLNYLETIYISHHQENVFNKNKKYSPDVIKTLSEQFPSNYLPKAL